MYHTMTIAGVQRDLPICKVSDDLYIGAFVIFGDVELTVKTAEALLKKAPEYDYMISAEAKGIPLIYEMARQSGQNKYFLARKAPKLYMSGVFDVKVNSITTAKEQHLYLDKADAELMRGKRILIVDDVISTGESLAAVEKLVEEAASSQAVWPSLPRATPRTATTSSTLRSCRCSTQTAPLRNNQKLHCRRTRMGSAAFCCLAAVLVLILLLALLLILLVLLLILLLVLIAVFHGGKAS